jgi:hypothetical protein
MGDQRRRSRSGYITGHWSPLGVDKSEDASPINRPLGYEQCLGCLTYPDGMHLSWSVRLLAPRVVRCVSADALGRIASRYHHRYQIRSLIPPSQSRRWALVVASWVLRPRPCGAGRG